MADAETVSILPGVLNTTLAPTALQPGQARDLLNCDTGYGDFRLDIRHRRFMSPPSLLPSCLPFTGSGTGSSVARTGATGTWIGLDNIGASDDAYAISPAVDIAAKTPILRVAGFTPPAALASVGMMAIRVERRCDPDAPAPLMTDDLVQPTLSGAALGPNLSTGTGLPHSDSTVEYTVDLAGLGVTLEQIEAGDVGVDLGWKSTVLNADDFNPANWIVAVTPTSPQTKQHVSTLITSQSYTITATWHPTTVPGDTPAPPYVPLSIHSKAQGQGAQHTDQVGDTGMTYALGYEGTVTVDNGLGTVVSGSIGSTPVGDPDEDGGGDIPLLLAADSTAKRLAAVTGGVGTLTITQTANISVTGDYPQDARADFTLSAAITTADPATIKVDVVSVSFCPSGAETAGGAPAGLGYASSGGANEYVVVHGPRAFSTPAESIQGGYSGPWTADLAGGGLGDSQFVLWAFGGKEFLTSPESGTWFRTIGEGDFQPLYLDTQSPGSSGDATYVAATDWLDVAHFDPGADIVWCSNVGGVDADNGFITTGDDTGLVKIGTSENSVTVRVTKSVPIDATEVDALGIILTDKTETRDGYRSAAASNTVRLKNSSGTQTAYLQTLVAGKLDTRGGSYFGWVDLSGIPDSIRGDIKEIEMTVGTRPDGGVHTSFRFEHIVFGNYRYKDTLWGKGMTVADTPSIEYAYDIAEGGTVGQARKFSVPSATHLGLRLESTAPFMGAAMTITVPKGDAPFTSGATIRLYRSVGGAWRKVATASNADDLVFYDTLQDADIAADPTTYPTYSPDFDEPTVGFSGQVTGIVTGCAWKGSNLYSGADGKIYGSRTNTFDDVEWDNVVRTNDPGSEDLGPPRTAVIADDLVSPALCLVPGESLYLLTATEAYVMIPGETFYTASFSRKIDGARGVLGIRAACVDGDACLYGAPDGLWYVRKTAIDTGQPDTFTEVTADNRGAWAWLLGDSPSTTVVRKHLGETWCLNETRYLHFTRQGRTIKGEWADGRGVVDAVSDPSRGLVMQLSDGSLAVAGPYVTDGGTNVNGSNGAVPEWTYRTGVRILPHAAMRAIVHATLGTGGLVRVDAESDRVESPASVSLSGEGYLFKSEALARVAGGGNLLSATLVGRAADRVLSADLELVGREVTRGLNRTQQ